MVSAESVSKVLGRRLRAGGSVPSIRLLLDIRAGLPFSSSEYLAKTGVLATDELERLIPRRTLQDRRRRGNFSIEQGELLVRVARIHALAERILGSAEKARAWLRTPVPALDDQLPLSLLDTEEGGRVVEAVLGRIEHGVFS